MDDEIQHYTKKEIAKEFLKERFKAITFRVFSISSVAFDVISIAKKYLRGHHIYWILSSIFLVLSTYLGAFYSLLANYESNEQQYSALPTASRSKERPMMRKDTNKIDHLQKLSDDDEESDEKVVEPDTERKSRVTFMTPSKKENEPEIKVELKAGTKVVPKFEHDGNSEVSEEAKRKGESLRKIIMEMFKSSSKTMFLMHVFPFPKCYRFIRSSLKLLAYLNEGFRPQSSKELERGRVKKTAYSQTFHDFCHEEYVSKQISLLIASFENVPMLLVDLAYWSKYGKGLSSFNNVIISDSYNYIELAAIVVNMIKLSYFLISLQNQARKLDVTRQDLKLLHAIYLTFIHFLYISSHLLAFHVAISIHPAGAVLAVSIKLLQLVIYFLVSRDLQRGENIRSMISAILMLFMYAPANKGHRISHVTHYIIFIMEMISLVVFGVVAFSTGIVSSESYFVLGKIDRDLFLYISLGCVGIFVLAIFLEWLQIYLFRYYKKMERRELRKIIMEVNNKYKTSYELLEDENISNSKSTTIFLA